MWTEDQAKFLLKLAGAQSILAVAIAKALDVQGVTTVDELTRFMEKINGGGGQPTNEIVEGMIDAMRAGMLPPPTI